MVTLGLKGLSLFQEVKHFSSKDTIFFILYLDMLPTLDVAIDRSLSIQSFCVYILPLR